MSWKHLKHHGNTAMETPGHWAPPADPVRKGCLANRRADVIKTLNWVMLVGLDVHSLREKAVKHDQEARRWRGTPTMERAPNPVSVSHN